MTEFIYLLLHNYEGLSYTSCYILRFKTTETETTTWKKAHKSKTWWDPQSRDRHQPPQLSTPREPSIYVLMTEIQTIDGGQKDVLLKRANIRNTAIQHQSNTMPKTYQLSDLQKKTSVILIKVKNFQPTFLRKCCGKRCKINQQS